MIGTVRIFPEIGTYTIHVVGGEIEISEDKDSRAHETVIAGNIKQLC